MRKVAIPIFALSAMAATAAISACAPVEGDASASAGESERRQCFFTREIDGYADAPDGPDGERRFYIETSRDENWLFETIGSCHDLDFTTQIALDTRGMSSVCTGHTETLLVPSPTGTRRCSVRVLSRMTDDERDAAKEAAEAAE